jgi:SAM-dependent methyltransferase
MPAEVRLSPKARRTVLEQLSRDRLRELTMHFDLEVTDRRSTDSYIDAIVRKHSLDFGALLETLRREELQAACEALGLDTSGREKAKLVARILGEEPAAPKQAPANVNEQPAASEVPEAEIRNEGALKSALRRFVLALAGGLRGRDAATTFTSRLLQCFGWPAAGPPGVTLPATLAVVDNGRRAQRDVALYWQDRRVLLDVVKHDVMLDFAWKDLLRVCLQVDPVPQYVVLTNQRDLQLYDLARDRDVPRLAIALDDLPKYSEAFPFLSPTWRPGATPKIINVSKVSGEVAELVARLYRSLKEANPKQDREVVQFTLQCILTMFAEDIGLLPQEYFTSLLYEGARHGDTGKRLAELFRLMGTRDVSGQRPVPYFNGGLFTNPITLPLGDLQLAALTKAAEAGWKYVDPHIFGSVFQGIMNDAERHKSGAHYTAHEDIMRVVGPTIVEPWRARIRDAKSLAELLEVRAALLRFRVLDPACGSGNFLYVSFRELYRLDTELLARIREFPSTQGQGKAKVTWAVGISTANFFGIDINPFAVELAKVTLNIAKKIAFDERREVAADLVGQMELEVDPSLPLDNLDKNVVCADALFTDWPEVEAIVSNPPFLGTQKIRAELGAEYLEKLQTQTGLQGVVDIVCYWFRRAHDVLPDGGRAGLIATSAIRHGKARESSLDYLVAGGGTITNAVSSRIWPGEAALNVSMVNWINGPAEGPFTLVVDGEVFLLPRIPTHLQLHCDVSEARALGANEGGTTMGVIFGHDAFRSGTPGFPSADPGGKRAIRPMAGGDDMLRGLLENEAKQCIYLAGTVTEDDARSLGGRAYEHLKKHVYPWLKEQAERPKATSDYATWLRKWWKPQKGREDFFLTASKLERLIACSKVLARPIFAFIDSAFVPNDTMQVFAFDDDYSFGIIHSSLHWEWIKATGGKVRADKRYTSGVWTTFPWPQEPSEAEVAAVAAAARELRRVRDTLMKENGWSLRTLYQAAEIPGPHPLKEAQAALDQAVAQAYGMPADQEATEFLLELNKLVAEDEAEGRPVQGPGVPKGLNPRDARWISDDCIMPPQ